MDSEQQSTTNLVEEQKTIETTIDGDKTIDKTIETTQVVNESKSTDEVVMNEDNVDEQSSIKNENVEEVKEKEEEEVTEAKEASKVEEVDMVDTEQPNKSVEEPNQSGVKELSEKVADVNMDQVISEVKDNVIEKSNDQINLEEKLAADEQAAVANTNSQEPLNEKVVDNKIDELIDSKPWLAELQQPTAKKQRIDVNSMQTRQYLDHTVVPILLNGLSSLAKARPENPIEYLANYLLDNKTKYDNNQENQSLNGN